MVEGARLERVCASNRTQGSNPCLSAKYHTAWLDAKSGNFASSQRKRLSNEPYKVSSTSSRLPDSW